MKVNLKSAMVLGGKEYQPGVQEVPDSLYANVRFKELVKGEIIILVARDDAAQKSQASKDARAALAAQTVQASSQRAVDERAGGKSSKNFSQREKPTLSSVDEAIAQLPTPAKAVVPAAEGVNTAQALKSAPPASVPAAAQAPGNKKDKKS